MRTTVLGTAMVAVVLGGCGSTRDLPGQPGEQTARSFSAAITRDVTLPYLLYLPAGYQDSPEAWPLVVFLHGAGERGSNLDLVTRHGPPKLVSEGKGFPFILLSPQCPEDEMWSPQILSALLDDIEQRCRVDKERIYVTGLSMGGNGTWRLAISSPRRFAAIAPICGWADTTRVCTLRDLPVWAFHGARDKVVPLEKTQSLVNELKACGGKVRLTVYPEAGHDSWSATYENPAFFEWLLGQRRTDRRP